MPATGHTVKVNLPLSPYSVRIAAGLIERVGAEVASVSTSRRVGVVTDSTVGPLYIDRVTSSLRSGGFEPIVATIPAGEAHKTLPTLLPVYDAFLNARFERSTPIIALGGGVVGDMTGFVAATILRGVPFIQIPMTLLAMVDASVGGKTGVDHAAGKNLIGAFHQPAIVLIDPDVLKSLPPRELRSGLAECIKHEIIRDEAGFAKLEANLDRILQLDITTVADLIAHNVQIKANVVAADPFENGERVHLNFGHTFGHAIETVSNFSYAHGEAIALGMTAACHAAVKLGMLTQIDKDRITRLISRAGLPIAGMKLDVDAVVDAMFFDKKVKDGKLRFVLPGRIGHVVIRDDLPRGLVAEAIHSLKG
ncbi:MAG: 3-dehydroquinate synthase [Burkholderiales bacterium]|nr:3-dehydroquinate synthase [Phycisphaerae bacterium]